jgi:hypothetical protein
VTLTNAASADRARPAAGTLLATLLGLGSGELEAAGRAGGDPDAAEQMQSGLLGRDGWGRGCRLGRVGSGLHQGLQSQMREAGTVSLDSREPALAQSSGAAKELRRLVTSDVVVRSGCRLNWST